MDLRRKLATLGRPAAAAPAEPAGSERESALSKLRREMAEILERPPTVAGPRPELRVDELPFSRVETESGPLYVRRERLAPSHHVGTIPVDAALAAKPELLSLLALDPSLAETDVARALFLDTETTGLGGSGTIAFVVGLALFEEGSLVIEQLLLRTPSEERPLLEHVGRLVEGASLLVTFNGKAFDVPTLSGRFVLNRLPVPPPRPHLDLLHVARRIHRARIRSCTLKSLESEILGFVRDADIDGGDVAPRYGHYLRTGDESALVPVVEHNAWDVVSMAALVGLYGEPLGTLHAEDLVGLSRTFRRARALDRAEEAAELSVRRGAGAEGLRARGEIAKARGDLRRALEDFEELARSVDDERARLELAKLYEHWVKSPEQALAVTALGTGEAPVAHQKRRARLEKKVRAGRR
ncbi:MAG TPA: ribonuclease H-like domain-containing protein [Polyangiaceae bacterium]|nr:ribonuclease H-like domain-containing protein [Polyangiaceae bacterium]